MHLHVNEREAGPAGDPAHMACSSPSQRNAGAGDQITGVRAAQSLGGL